MKRILFTIILSTLFGFSQAQIILSNCPDLDEDLHCMGTRWDGNVGEFALINIYVNIPSTLQGNKWKVQFSTNDPTPDFIEYSNFRNSLEPGYTHEYSYVLPVNSNQNQYVFKVFLLDERYKLLAQDKQMTFAVCGSNSQKMSITVNEEIQKDKSNKELGFESFSFLNEEDEINFKAFPNPFKEDFSLQYRAVQNEDVVLEIFDISGTLHYTSTFRHETTGIYLKRLEHLNLEKGAYLCRVISNNIYNTIKLLKAQ